MYESRATKLSNASLEQSGCVANNHRSLPPFAQTDLTTPETPKFDACVSVTLQIATTAFTVGLQPTASMRAHNRKMLECAPHGMHSPHHTNSRRFRKVFEVRHLPTPQKLLWLRCFKNLHFSMNTDEKPIRNNNNNKAQPEGEFAFV
ncbi:hypothetical protein CEXT_142041 [Caerostris extrusa]|uniref:Uncharacterized protein n=1 Tax=Caerostris extrusa TaxID=172846 RepID=A0AAV4XLN4_CAEEX|nr:hypothetical protein CEXT_142041 [Caerostris extrusa]